MDPDILVEGVSKTFNASKRKSDSFVQQDSHHSYLNNKMIALDKISFHVSKGEMIAIIGLNGSGKTTLLRIIAGILKPDSGIIRVNGIMAPILQIGTGFHNELTTRENIMISGMLLGISKSEIKKRIDTIIEFAELQEFTEMKLKHFSSGMKSRLAFSISLQVEPDILLVDEILSVGDIKFRQKSFNSFLSFKKKGKTIVYATHNLSDLPRICDRVVLLDNGRMIMIGKPEEVIEKYKSMMSPINASLTESKKVYDVLSTQELKVSSRLIPIDCTKIYQWKIKINYAKIEVHSAYIAILFLKNGKEVGRRIRYIENSSDFPREYRIVSAAPSQADNAILAYRVNCEGSERGHNMIEFPPMENNLLKLIENDIPQEYDDLNSFEKLYKNVDLEKNYWALMGGHQNQEAFYEEGKHKLKTLVDLGLKPDSTLLEVGCGTGIMVKPLESYLISPRNYLGTDLSEDAVNFCKKHYPQFEFFKNEITNLPKFDRQFDIICLFNVFTHIYPKEIIELLIDMKKYLKPNGCIIAGVFINSTLSDYTGTRDKIEFKENYFVQLVKSTGFSEVVPYRKGLDNVQFVFKIIP